MEINNKVFKEKLTEVISKLNKKDFTINFFIIDTKGVANGNTRFIYETAKDLIDNGYKCHMLYQQEKEVAEVIENGKRINKEIEVQFIGVREWMGDDYANIPHGSIGSENIKVSTSDFLIIPEIFANVMNQTKKLPCKRIILSQNLNHITEFMQLGSSWSDFGIIDVITTTEVQEKEIKELFPYMHTKIINPSIPAYFRNNSDPKKLAIAVVVKDPSKLKKLVNQFFWKYPQYRWITFMDLKNLPRELFADTLRESAITVWIDDETYFGQAPVEAIKSGSIVIGKIPETIPEWMWNQDKTDMSTNGLWFNDFKDVHKLIAQAIKLWMDDQIPSIITDEMIKMNDKYSKEQKETQTISVIKELIEERIEELKVVINKIDETK